MSGPSVGGSLSWVRRPMTWLFSGACVTGAMRRGPPWRERFAGAVIHSFCHLQGVTVGPGAEIGPFARLRPGAEIGERAKVGNFVELKNARLGAGAKINHLTYIGDARVGAGANVGAGTITCNYDGFAKHRTEIGAGAFIGSNSALVAPVRVGEGAYVGAGSTITRDVPDDALGVARGRQVDIEGGAARFRAKRSGSRPTDHRSDGPPPVRDEGKTEA